MKTICKIGQKIVMSQDGDAVDVMEKNAAQYPGACVEVVSDDEFYSAMNSQVEPVKILEPVERLRLFLAQNPDVLELINQ